MDLKDDLPKPPSPSQPCALFAINVLYPLVCFIAAIHRTSLERITWQDAYVEQLLEPRDWFSFWRLNCSLAR